MRNEEIIIYYKPIRIRVIVFFYSTLIQAASPLWSFKPNTTPVMTISPFETKTVIYTVTNNSFRTHELMIKPTNGITQMNPCVLGPSGSMDSTCTLTLSIVGSAVPIEGIFGGPVMCQVNPDGTPNPNQCYQPSAGDTLAITRVEVGQTSLSATPSSLVLSVNNTGLNAALTGNPRQIVIQNTGPDIAVGLAITYPTWPTGTTAVSSCGSTLASGASCTITIIPGPTPSSNCNTGLVPAPVTVSVNAGNVVTPVSSDALVLSYGCIYQGGFIYYIEDRYLVHPIGQSIGGRVVSGSDQVQPTVTGGPGIIWSSNGVGSLPANVSRDLIPYITETAGVNSNYSAAQTLFNTTYANTGSFPFPPSSAFQNCSGAYDGACNTSNIIAFYNLYNTNYGVGASPYTLAAGPTSATLYPAGICSVTNSGGFSTGWYLPAICEMGTEIVNSSCPAGVQTILLNLPFLIGLVPNITESCVRGSNCITGNYWSSTEAYITPDISAWRQTMVLPLSSNNQVYSNKSVRLGVRCVRLF